MAVAQAVFLRRQLHGFEIGRTLRAVAGILVASALLGVVSYGVWYVLDQALGTSLLGQLVSVTQRARARQRGLRRAPCWRSGSRRRSRSSR